MNNHEKEISEKVMQLLTANWISQPLYVITKLGIPDILGEGPKNINDISQITGSYEPYLYRIMRALASIGFFHEDENRVFGITPMGEILQKKKMRPIVLMFLSEWHSKAWNKLYHSVKTGDIAFNSAHGISCFEWLKKNPEAAEEFNMANEIKSIKGNSEVVNAYDFTGVKSIIDIGGGYGGLLYQVLLKNPHIKGIVADLPYVKKNAEKRITINYLNDRCVFTKCNSFEKIPEGADYYIMSNILHDWDDDKCNIILKNCYNSMRTDNKLVAFVLLDLNTIRHPTRCNNMPA